MWKHSDGSIAYYMKTLDVEMVCDGACLSSYTSLQPVSCTEHSGRNFICEFPQNVTFASNSDGRVPNLMSSPSVSRDMFHNVSFLACPSGHATHMFLACDAHSACWKEDTSWTSSCSADLTPLPPSFPCQDGTEQIPYTLVCDHQKDCYDNSDEQFCSYEPCDPASFFACKNKQICDDVPQCTDASDEQCGVRSREQNIGVSITPPAVINFDGHGKVIGETPSTSSNNGLFVCPDTHLQCANDGYCLPVFVWCNTIHDCPKREDEEHCDRYTCPGFYRCRASSVCLHPQHVCDSMYQCPQRDDELLCGATCPEQCTCHGQAFFCGSVIPPSSYPDLRFLDASDSGLQYAEVSNNTLLIYLRLARCDLTNLTLVHLSNLHSLDLSKNRLTSITDQHLSHLPHLRHLTLSDNPLTTFIQLTQHSAYIHHHLQSLDVSQVIMKELDMSMFAIYPNLVTLNLTNCRVDRITSGGFQALQHLTVLDTRGCSIEHFSGQIFKGLKTLQTIFADNYKLCCQEILPKTFKSDDCSAPSNEMSSCQALLRSNVYRVVLVLFSLLAIAGNAVSFCIRMVNKIRATMGFDVFVANLCISDLLMGLYLAIVGVADQVYFGNYLWNDITWKQSIACHTAGFVSLLSSEVSAFIICLITLDRLLVLRFPFSQLHFHRISALLTCAGIWTVGLTLAAIPLLSITSHWQFYSQNGICIPLPITRQEFAGRAFAFNVMIVLNFVLFLLIAVGQAVIYQSVQKNKFSDSDCSTRSRKDHTLARRLLTIAISDFLCWFPIGLLGLLAFSGHAVASEVNVAMAILVLPLNSAINPFLYTLNIVMERLQSQRQQRMQQSLMKQIQQQNINFSTKSSLMSCRPAEAEQICARWLQQELLDKDCVRSWFKDIPQ